MGVSATRKDINARITALTTATTASIGLNAFFTLRIGKIKGMSARGRLSFVF
jgi:hypothetical protein